MDTSHLSREEQIEKYKEQLSKLEFEVIDNGLSEKSEKFLSELDSQFNKCYKILKIRVKNEYELLSGTLGTLSFLTEILNHNSLQPIIGELSPFETKYEFTKDVRGISSLYTLLGDLCSLLVFGGAYSSGTALKNEDLIQTVKSFIDDFLPDGYRNYDYYISYEPWNKWFCNVAWDYTFIVLNRNRKEMNLICITDSN